MPQRTHTAPTIIWHHRWTCDGSTVRSVQAGGRRPLRHTPNMYIYREHLTPCSSASRMHARLVVRRVLYVGTGAYFREEANERPRKQFGDGERSTVGGWDGNRRPRSKSAEGNREVQSKRDITLSKTGCYDPLSSTSLLFHLLISQFLFPQ